MPLHTDLRPDSFDEMIGNRKTISSLQSVLSREDRPHAYLITGPSGCGKTTIGRIIASELECSKYDFTEIDSADFRGIDTVRELRRNMRLAPMKGPTRVWLIDECHKMTNDAQNALLKGLEDPPDHAYLILATTDPQKLLKTIRNRCSTYTVQSLTEDQLLELVRKSVREIKAKVPKKVLLQIAQDALGSPRSALVMLDKIRGLETDEMLSAAKQAASDESQVIDLCRALLKKESWGSISSIIKGIEPEQEPETVRWAVMGYMTAVMMGGRNNRAAYCFEQFEEPFYNSGKFGLRMACYRCIFSD